MTLITVLDAERRQERGWDDPGYPIGIWTRGTVISHDASGGSAIAQVNLTTPDVPEGLAYSLEAFKYKTSATSNVDLMIQAVNFDITEGLSIPRGYQMGSFSGTGSGDDAMPLGRLDIPWFLGVVVDRTITAALSIITANVTGKTSVFHVAGYVWGPRSVLQVAGGYRRPPDGMFGI